MFSRKLLLLGLGLLLLGLIGFSYNLSRTASPDLSTVIDQVNLRPPIESSVPQQTPLPTSADTARRRRMRRSPVLRIRPSIQERRTFPLIFTPTPTPEIKSTSTPSPAPNPSPLPPPTPAKCPVITLECPNSVALSNSFRVRASVAGSIT